MFKIVDEATGEGQSLAHLRRLDVFGAGGAHSHPAFFCTKNPHSSGWPLQQSLTM